MARDIVSEPERRTVRERAPKVTGALPVSQAMFSDREVGFVAMPPEAAAFDDGGGVPLFDFSNDAKSYAKTIDGVPHQVRTAFRLYSDRVIVARAVRPLLVRPDRRLAPAGAWRHLDADAYVAAFGAQLTTGLVSAGTTIEAAEAALDPASIPAEQRPAARFWQYLPPLVRGSLERVVPTPNVWLAGMWQERVGRRGPLTQVAATVRVDATTAAFAVLERSIDPRQDRFGLEEALFPHAPWEATQVAFRHRGSSAPRERPALRGVR